VRMCVMFLGGVIGIAYVKAYMTPSQCLMAGCLPLLLWAPVCEPVVHPQCAVRAGVRCCRNVVYVDREPWWYELLPSSCPLARAQMHARAQCWRFFLSRASSTPREPSSFIGSRSPPCLSSPCAHYPCAVLSVSCFLVCSCGLPHMHANARTRGAETGDMRVANRRETT